MRIANGGWEFDVSGTGFEGTFRIELDAVPEVGSPQPIVAGSSMLANPGDASANSKPDGG
jgi:hypothetical protein